MRSEDYDKLRPGMTLIPLDHKPGNVYKVTRCRSTEAPNAYFGWLEVTISRDRGDTLSIWSREEVCKHFDTPKELQQRWLYLKDVKFQQKFILWRDRRLTNPREYIIAEGPTHPYGYHHHDDICIIMLLQGGDTFLFKATTRVILVSDTSIVEKEKKLCKCTCIDKALIKAAEEILGEHRVLKQQLQVMEASRDDYRRAFLAKEVSHRKLHEQIKSLKQQVSHLTEQLKKKTAALEVLKSVKKALCDLCQEEEE